MAFINRLLQAAPFALLATVFSIGSGSLPYAATLDELNGTMKNLLTEHCARCHQSGQTKGKYKDRPAGKLGYILDFDTLAKKGTVRPGNPESSPLYIKMKAGEMPKDTSDDCYDLEPPAGTYCGPKQTDIEDVHAWIEALGDAKKAAAIADDRKFIADDDIIKAIAQDLTKLPNRRHKNIRYFTLTHLYNSGDTDADLEVYRQAVAKLLNSLSRESDPARVVAVDERKTVLRVDISELGWDARQWNRITELSPYVIVYDNVLFGLLQKQTGAVTPFIRADWFAFAASQPPLYYDLLGLPKSKKTLEKLLGLNVLKNIAGLKVARAGFQKSGVSGNNRLIERHTIATGAYWESYDFSGNKERQSFFKFPLGPKGALGAMSQQHGFDHDGGEVIFSLPNGFHAYYLTTGKGVRIAKGPTDIVQDPARRDFAVTSGISCMGCHDKGIKFNDHRPREKHDQVRELVLTSRALSKQARDVVEAIFPPHEDFYKLMVSDAERYAAALKNAGININLKLNGVEMVNALFARFEENLTLRQAAAELGFTEQEFKARLSTGGKEANALRLRLMQDLVPRDQFVKDFAGLVNDLTDNKGLDFTAIVTKSRYRAEIKSARIPQISKTFDLAFFPNETKFRVGQKVSFTVKSAQPCYLTLINKDDQGQMQVLFPNRHFQDNKIQGGQSYRVPGRHIKGFAFKFKKAGKETIIAICSASRPDPQGILHDFSTKTFTGFKNYGAYLKKGKKARYRLLAIVKDGSGSARKTSREKEMPPLLKNPIDPHIDIQAQKGVILHVLH